MDAIKGFVGLEVEGFGLGSGIRIQVVGCSCHVFLYHDWLLLLCCDSLAHCGSCCGTTATTSTATATTATATLGI